MGPKVKFMKLKNVETGKISIKYNYKGITKGWLKNMTDLEIEKMFDTIASNQVKQVKGEKLEELKDCETTRWARGLSFGVMPDIKMIKKLDCLKTLEKANI